MRALATLLLLPSMCSRELPATADAAAADAAPPPSAPPPRDAGDPAAAMKAAKNRSRADTLARDIAAMVGKRVTTMPGEGDLSSKCDAALALRAQPELASVLDEAAALCAFDLPLLTASEAIDQLNHAPSQASRRLQCDVARREVARAREARPDDIRVRKVEAQRIEVCRW